MGGHDLARSSAAAISCTTAPLALLEDLERDVVLDQRSLEQDNRIAGQPLFELAVGAILRRIGTRVANLAVGQGLDQRRPPAGPRPLDRLARGGVNGEDVIAVNDHAGHRVGRGTVGDAPDRAVVTC